MEEWEVMINRLWQEDEAVSEGHLRRDIIGCNRKVLTAFNRELGKSGLLHQTVETHVATINDFASTLLMASIPPRGLLDLTSADIRSYLSEKSGKQLLTSFKRFVRFLMDTGRIDYEQG